MSGNNLEFGALFAPEREQRAREVPDSASGWKLLLVDDEPEIHEVTRLALQDFEFEQKPLHFLHAYSAKEATAILQNHADIAVAMIDVVMESEHAGLGLVRHIRADSSNHLMRLILRTGQPGQAPERQVICDYDINDYKEKTELSSQKLYSCVYTALRSYRDLQALDLNRLGLERVIRASSEIFRLAEVQQFIQGVLEQLIGLLYLGQDSFYLNHDSLALQHAQGNMTILAATGRYRALIGADASATLDPEVLTLVNDAISQQQSIFRTGGYAAYFSPNHEHQDVLYIRSQAPLSESALQLVQLFNQNALIAYQNVLLREEIEGTQRDIVYLLGEAIETRSRETGQHVRRVSEYCRLIATLLGFSKREIETIHLAAALHDFGKIGIPDPILQHAGTLTEEENRIMQSHASIGRELLERSQREILKAAAIIAGQHHERWDGSGYPDGLRGEQIHLYGRIAAIADAFDELGSKRNYKEAWPVEKIIAYLKAQRHLGFDAALVDQVVENLGAVLAIRDSSPD